MSKSNSNTFISLMQVFDDICENSISKTVSGSSYVSNGTLDVVGNYNFSPYTADYITKPFDSFGRRWYDFNYWWNTPTITYKIETPSYPVSNYSVTKEGTSIIEIAVSGFNADEITVKREDLKIIVEGKKADSKKDDRKYIYKNIGERDFTLEYIGSEKWDYDKLSVKLNAGILEIRIPIKEECKPVNKVYKITN